MQNYVKREPIYCWIFVEYLQKQSGKGKKHTIKLNRKTVFPSIEPQIQDCTDFSFGIFG